MKKTTKIILTVSILLNLLFIGLGVGAMTRHMLYAPGGFEFGGPMADLAPETRALMKQAMEDGRETTKPKFERMREVRQAMSTIMQAESFDAQAFDAKAQELRALKNEMAQDRIDSTKEIAAQLPAEERRKLAKHFERKYHKGHWKGHD